MSAAQYRALRLAIGLTQGGYAIATMGGDSLAIAANCREWAGEFREQAHPVTLSLFAAAQKLEANEKQIRALTAALSSAQQLLMSVACQPADELPDTLRNTLRAEALAGQAAIRAANGMTE